MGAADNGTSGSRTLPKSIRHKRILDLAGDRPDASLEDLAAEIPSATTDLVEFVLDECGDPAEQPQQESEAAGNSTQTKQASSPEYTDLTDVQQETVKAISEYPNDTQQELGERLGISASAVYNRVKGIEGFDWDRRQQLATMITPQVDGGQVTDTDARTSQPPDQSDRLETLQHRIQTLENQFESDTSGDRSKPGSSNTEARSQLVVNDTELLQKVLHACFASDTITKDEELQLLKQTL